MSNNNRKTDFASKKKAKTIFFVLLATTIVMIAAVVVGLVFSFIYISYLELWQSLIVGGAMAYLIAWTVVTTVWYNKAFKRDDE